MAITLTGGMRQSLLSLQNTNQLLDKTSNRLATGLKVQSALDDPVKFFAAKGHRDRSSDLSLLKTDMGEAIQTIKATNNGIEAITDLIAQAKSLAQSAKSATTTATNETYRVQYQDILDQIDGIAADASYKGVNLTNSASTTLSVKFNEGGTESVTLTGFAGDATSLGVTDISTVNAFSVAGGGANTTKMDAAITALDTAKDTLRTKAETFSTSLSVISTRESFTSNMVNTLEDGADKLVNADLNEEGANMLMLQTRQALGTTSLSLASQAAQSILRLF